MSVRLLLESTVKHSKAENRHDYWAHNAICGANVLSTTVQVIKFSKTSVLRITIAAAQKFNILPIYKISISHFTLFLKPSMSFGQRQVVMGINLSEIRGV